MAVLVPNVRFDVTLGTLLFVSWLIVRDMPIVLVPNVCFFVTLGTLLLVKLLSASGI